MKLGFAAVVLLLGFVLSAVQADCGSWKRCWTCAADEACSWHDGECRANRAGIAAVYDCDPHPPFYDTLLECVGSTNRFCKTSDEGCSSKCKTFWKCVSRAQDKHSGEDCTVHDGLVRQCSPILWKTYCEADVGSKCSEICTADNKGALVV